MSNSCLVWLSLNWAMVRAAMPARRDLATAESHEKEKACKRTKGSPENSNSY